MTFDNLTSIYATFYYVTLFPSLQRPCPARCTERTGPRSLHSGPRRERAHAAGARPSDPERADRRADVRGQQAPGTERRPGQTEGSAGGREGGHHQGQAETAEGEREMVRDRIFLNFF